MNSTSTDSSLVKCLEAVSSQLAAGESIVRVTLAEPELASHADYFTRYKIDVGQKNPSGTEITRKRCVIVKISSNTGLASVDNALSCDRIGDMTGL